MTTSTPTATTSPATAMSPSAEDEKSQPEPALRKQERTDPSQEVQLIDGTPDSGQTSPAAPLSPTTSLADTSFPTEVDYQSRQLENPNRLGTIEENPSGENTRGEYPIGQAGVIPRPSLYGSNSHDGLLVSLTSRGAACYEGVGLVIRGGVPITGSIPSNDVSPIVVNAPVICGEPTNWYDFLEHAASLEGEAAYDALFAIGSAHGRDITHPRDNERIYEMPDGAVIDVSSELDGDARIYPSIWDRQTEIDAEVAASCDPLDAFECRI